MNRPGFIWAKKEGSGQGDIMEVSSPADEGGHLQPSPGTGLASKGEAKGSLGLFMSSE